MVGGDAEQCLLPLDMKGEHVRERAKSGISIAATRQVSDWHDTIGATEATLQTGWIEPLRGNRCDIRGDVIW